MRLFSYIVKSDRGFAPNPFCGYCTLACCKPSIRRVARVGDLVVGLSPKADGNRIVYIMRVTEEKMSFAEYWHDPRFHMKRAVFRSRLPERRVGDNIYRPCSLSGYGYQQQPSCHSQPDGTEDGDNKKRDLRGKWVVTTTSVFVRKPRWATRMRTSRNVSSSGSSAYFSGDIHCRREGLRQKTR